MSPSVYIKKSVKNIQPFQMTPPVYVVGIE
jgi:hypothetical protein